MDLQRGVAGIVLFIFGLAINYYMWIYRREDKFVGPPLTFGKAIISLASSFSVLIGVTLIGVEFLGFSLGAAVGTGMMILGLIWTLFAFFSVGLPEISSKPKVDAIIITLIFFLAIGTIIFFLWDIHRMGW